MGTSIKSCNNFESEIRSSTNKHSTENSLNSTAKQITKNNNTEPSSFNIYRQNIKSNSDNNQNMKKYVIDERGNYINQSDLYHNLNDKKESLKDDMKIQFFLQEKLERKLTKDEEEFSNGGFDESLNNSHLNTPNTTQASNTSSVHFANFNDTSYNSNLNSTITSFGNLRRSKSKPKPNKRVTFNPITSKKVFDPEQQNSLLEPNTIHAQLPQYKSRNKKANIDFNDISFGEETENCFVIDDYYHRKLKPLKLNNIRYLRNELLVALTNYIAYNNIDTNNNVDILTIIKKFTEKNKISLNDIVSSSEENGIYNMEFRRCSNINNSNNTSNMKNNINSINFHNIDSMKVNDSYIINESSVNNHNITNSDVNSTKSDSDKSLPIINQPSRFSINSKNGRPNCSDSRKSLFFKHSTSSIIPCNNEDQSSFDYFNSNSNKKLSLSAFKNNTNIVIHALVNILIIRLQKILNMLEFFRIDAIFLEPIENFTKIKLYVMTELNVNLFLIDNIHVKVNYYKALHIKYIDFITISSKNDSAVLHLVQIHNNSKIVNPNIKSSSSISNLASYFKDYENTLMINHPKSDHFISLVTSNYFFWKKNSILNTRKISVITVNNDFPAYNKIKINNDFHEFKTSINKFLEKEIKPFLTEKEKAHITDNKCFLKYCSTIVNEESSYPFSDDNKNVLDVLYTYERILILKYEEVNDYYNINKIEIKNNNIIDDSIDNIVYISNKTINNNNFNEMFLNSNIKSIQSKLEDRKCYLDDSCNISDTDISFIEADNPTSLNESNNKSNLSLDSSISNINSGSPKTSLEGKSNRKTSDISIKPGNKSSFNSGNSLFNPLSNNDNIKSEVEREFRFRIIKEIKYSEVENVELKNNILNINLKSNKKECSTSSDSDKNTNDNTNNKSSNSSNSNNKSTDSSSGGSIKKNICNETLKCNFNKENSLDKIKHSSHIEFKGDNNPALFSFLKRIILSLCNEKRNDRSNNKNKCVKV